MSPDIALQDAAIGAAWLAFVYKAPSLWRHRHDRSLITFCATGLLMAFALTVLVDPFHTAIDRLTGIPNVAQLAGNLVAVASGCTGLIFLGALNHEPERVRRLELRFAAMAGLAAVLMGILFFAGPTRPEVPDYWIRYGHIPEVVIYRAILLSWIAFVLGNVIRLTFRYAPMWARPSMRLGLRLVGLGGVAGMYWTVNEVAVIGFPLLGFTAPPPAAHTAGQIAVVLTVGLITVGSSLPTWGPRVGVDRALSWVADWRALGRLRPLWDALRRAAPDVALHARRPPLLDLLDPRDVHFRLYRRVVEVRDVMLLVNERVDQRAAQHAHDVGVEAGLPALQLQALVGAAEIASALDRPAPEARSRRPRLEAKGAEAADFNAEVRSLVLIAHYYPSSRLLRQALGRLDQEEEAARIGELAR